MDDLRTLSSNLSKLLSSDKIEDINEAKSLWNTIKNNKDVINYSISLRGGYHHNPISFNSNLIAALILLEYKDFDGGLIRQIVDLIYNNENLLNTTVEINYKNLNNNQSIKYTFLLLTLTMVDFPLKSKQKAIAIEYCQNARLRAKHNNISGYNIRDLMLHNNNFNKREKIKIIETFSNIEWYNYILLLQNRIKNIYLDIGIIKRDFEILRCDAYNLRGKIEDKTIDDIDNEINITKELIKIRQPKTRKENKL